MPLLSDPSCSLSTTTLPYGNRSSSSSLTPTVVGCPADTTLGRPARTDGKSRRESEVVEVDRDHQEIADGFQVRRAHVGTTLRRKSDPIDRDGVSDILRDGESAGDVDVI